jgi:hypothetical protein
MACQFLLAQLLLLMTAGLFERGEWLASVSVFVSILMMIVGPRYRIAGE